MKWLDKENTWFGTTIVALVVILGIAWAAFNVIYDVDYLPHTVSKHDRSSQTYNLSTAVVSPNDSIKMLSAKVDSLQKVVEHIDGQYQEDIDITLEKINGWIGFWLTLISVIVALVGFWQIYRQHNIDEDVKKMMKEVDLNTKKNIEKTDANIKRVKEVIDVMKKRTNLIHLTQSANEIPNPDYIPNSLARKQLSRQYLMKITEAFGSYINSISKKKGNIILGDVECYNLSSCLVHLSVSLTKIKPLFSDRPNNVRIQQLKDKITYLIMDCLNGDHNKSYIIEKMVEIHKLLIAIANSESR